MKAERTVLGVELYTQEQLAELLGIARSTVAKYIRTKRLPARRVGRRYLITPEDVRLFLTGQLQQGAGSAELP